ncbi:hypothetical protein LSH36_37g14024 [Paralvinella palmiformis]|uniref:DUF4503 domain-containing protein n=1 Tax=Paralvinella palmiformis TaxID=53620 RepID=A0AAD9KA36_9ANNE|nr:hypothetical protein LSH36_37g14024 [Paralvinella palmiformis]
MVPEKRGKINCKLSDYAIESEDATGDDPSYRPARQNVLEKRRTRHSFGCCRDMDWQRRMEVDQTPSPDIQEIDDWSSSSDDHDQEDIVEDDVDDIHDDINTIKTITPEVKSSEYDCFQVHQRGILQHQKQDNINEIQDLCVINDSSESGDTDGKVNESDDCLSEENFSPAISTSDSWTSVPQPRKDKKSKVSEWIKNISWKPVDKGKAYHDDVLLDSSAKKKRIVKYLKHVSFVDGARWLAGIYVNSGAQTERLHRLIRQEKSSRAFHTHKVQNLASVKSASAKNVVIEIRRVRRGHSLVTTLSSVLAQSDITGSLTVGEHLFVLFTEAIWLEHKLEAGVKLRVNAPWQVLKQPKANNVILCTCHLEVLERPSQTSKSNTSGTSQHLYTITKWICPCAKGNSLESQVNVQQVPIQCVYTEFGHQIRLKNDVEDIENRQIKLETMTSSPSPNVCHSLLMAIEKNTGGSEKAVDFVATVQRVFLKKNRNLDKSLGLDKECENILVYTLLLQDFCGFLCELVLPVNAECKDPWKTLIKHGEGKAFEFRRLHLLQRINRSKLSQLFAMIDSVWSYASVLEKSTSQDSEQSGVIPAQPPLFSYMLQASAGEASCVEYKMHQLSIYCPKVIRSFQDVLAMLKAEEVFRCTMEGRVIYEKVNMYEGTSQKLIYVISKYDETGYLKVVIPQAACYNITESVKKCILLQDVFIGQGQCILDEYSSVCDNGVPFPLMTSHVLSRLPQFTIPAKVDSLYFLQGTLSDIDELTAYSWLACDRCNNDKLQGGTTLQPFLYCTLCKRGIEKPVKKMNLDVHVTLPGLDNRTVKVKLLQPTIEALLPLDAADDEQGYDVQTVLGKSIGPIPVVVTSVLHQVCFLEELNLD